MKIHSTPPPQKKKNAQNCLSFGKECRSVNFGSNVSPRNISIGGHDPGSLTLVQADQKNLEVEVLFLLGKNVEQMV